MPPSRSTGGRRTKDRSTPTASPNSITTINISSARSRVQTIANLLVNDLGVPQSSITREIGHGNADQPDPDDPSSAANRVVVITYTVK